MLLAFMVAGFVDEPIRFREREDNLNWRARRMIEAVPVERIGEMTTREKRWLDNVKKAIYDSDYAYLADQKRDRCFPELCKAIDTAKTLCRSLNGDDTSPRDNKRRFLEFFGGPEPSEGGYQSGVVVDARTGKEIRYTLGSLVYAIRCMVHENENLDLEESPDYQVLLDWNGPFRYRSHLVSQFADECIVVNAEMLLGIVRERVTRFVSYIDSVIAMQTHGLIRIDTRPPLCSIRPGENFVVAKRS
ncbi:hypothetical protein RE6C_03223 [Rhodopirellula europaea 6C]|uniref:Uncharacterized protein n=2 Tax=Rhodopirellula TaxID=265488 RepID=M2ATN9_9BACT|nr:hypothetical protein RE6C_03223 [Rhodopirellula europaea 6C]